MNLLEMLQNQYGSKVSSHLQNRYGMDESQAREILPKMAPFVLGGLKNKMDSPDGEAAAHQVLNEYGDEGVLDDVDGHLERASAGETQLPGGLASILGGGNPGSQQVMANQLGVSPDMLGKLLPVLAPLILGAITKNTRGVGRDPQSGGGLGDILGSVLGGQGGGDLLGQVAGQVLGGGGGAGQKSGCLGALLGGLLGGKR